MRRLLLVLTSLCTLSPLLVSRGAGEAKAPAPPQVRAKQVERGARLYDAHCSVCHGERAGGLEEARLAFPEDHRRCESCHKSGGSKVWTFPFKDNNMFDVGKAPALRGKGSLERFPNALTLYGYIHSAMPRHAPGSLENREYLDITAFLLELQNVFPKGTVLSKKNAGSILLK